MHEFGHNLGLRHGGSVNTNYIPNYVSIMNYLYQIRGLPTIGTSEGDRYYYYRAVSLVDTDFASYLPYNNYSLTNNMYQSSFIMDYSDGSGGSIDESAVNETLGLVRSGSLGVDFNGDQDAVDTISKDINNDSVTGTLSDYNDWANLNLFFQRYLSGDNTGAYSADVIKIVPDPVGDDRQDYIIETLTSDDMR